MSTGRKVSLCMSEFFFFPSKYLSTLLSNKMDYLCISVGKFGIDGDVDGRNECDATLCQCLYLYVLYRFNMCGSI